MSIDLICGFENHVSLQDPRYHLKLSHHFHQICMEYVIIWDDINNHRYFQIHLMRTKHHYKQLHFKLVHFLVVLAVDFMLLLEKHNKEESN